jgi:predicted HAD superfamily hydrolase
MRVRDLIVLIEKLKLSPAYIEAKSKKERLRGKPFNKKEDDNFLVYDFVEKLEELVRKSELKVNDLIDLEINIKKIDLEPFDIKLK